MNEEDGQALNGKIEGLKLVLMSLIATMNADHAVEAAKYLSEILEDVRGCDVDEEGPINECHLLWLPVVTMFLDFPASDVTWNL